MNFFGEVILIEEKGVEFSNYVLRTGSNDNNYLLVLNTKTDEFIRISKECLDSSEYREKIVEYLSDHLFLKNDGEKDYIEEKKRLMIDSDDVLMLIIIATRQCNFRCSYCYEEFSDSAITETAAENIVKMTEKKLTTKKFHHLIISWFGGEPLLNIDMIDYLSSRLINICEKNNVEYHGTITTNGYLLSMSNVQRLFSDKVRLFQITVDGSEEQQDRNRIPLDSVSGYAVIKQNLIQMHNMDESEEFKVLLRTNLSSGSIKYLDKYEKDFMRIFKDDKRFSFDFEPVFDVKSNYPDAENSSILDQVYKYSKMGYRFSHIKQQLSGSSMCYARKNNHYVIDPDCKIYKCTVALNSGEDVGRINESGEIVFNSKLKRWNVEKHKKCDECRYYACCLGGKCPLRNRHSGECNNYVNFDKILRIMETQKEYSLTIKKGESNE